MTAKLVDDITDTHSAQDPRGLGPGRRQHRHRLLRRHGRLRHDRPDDDQREGLRRPHPHLHVPGRRVPAGPRRRSRATSSRIIPMAALVAVMIMVSVGTFDWHSIQPDHAASGCPGARPLVMVATVAVVVATHNLAIGVIVGVAHRHGHVRPPRRPLHRGRRRRPPRRGHPRLRRHRRAVLRLQQRPRLPVRLRRRPEERRHRPVRSRTSGTPRPSPRWTPSQTKYEAKGKNVTIIGLNDASQERHERLAGHLAGGH